MRAAWFLGFLSGTGACLWSLSGCQQQPNEQANKIGMDTIELVVITPHSNVIREAFTDGFRKWQANQKPISTPITLRWISRGTVDCQRYVSERFGEHPERSDQGIGVDVFFGGGLSIHQAIAAQGFAQQIKLQPSILMAIPKELNGQPLYDPSGSWHGTALGGYGIFFNERACRMRNVPIPTTWADLAQPAYTGWVAAADPALSGSTTQCLNFILLTHGWEQGWPIVMGLLANCNGLLPNSAMIAPNVESGIALAGLEPEFVARMNIANSSEKLDYVNPASATAILPDPITVLKGTENLHAAVRFVEFVLSPEGQTLWMLPFDTPGGPPDDTLYRYSIRPDIYEKYHDQLATKGNPFTEPNSFRMKPEEDQAYTALLPHLVKAACGKNHLALQQACRKAAAMPAPLAAIKAPPFTKEQAMEFAQVISKDPQKSRQLEAEWSTLFEKRYGTVLGKAAP